MFSLAHSRVPYYRVGQGPDVLLIHGWPLTSATFRKLVPRLARRYTCHLLDLPGTGASEWSEASEIGLRAHAATVRALVDRLGLSRYAIVAHDSGGGIGRVVAADDARVQGLALGNTEIAGHHPWQVRLYETLERLPLGARLFGASLRLRAVRSSPIAYGGCFADPAFAEGEFGELFVQPMLREPRVFEGQLRLVRGFDWSVLDELPQVHARLRAPVAFIWGEDDPFFPLARLRPTLAQFAAGAELHVLPRGKLFVHEEQPEAFADATERFLERVLPAVRRERRELA
jgi:pimeloyl-ACP methyl ester carboxylesterase